MKIDIDDDVLAALQADATPFLDTPNTVLRRLLGLPEIQGAEAELKRPIGRRRRRKKRTRIPNGLLLPLPEYYVPILRSVEDKGGRAPAREVIAAVGALLDGRLSPQDLQTLPTGNPRWATRTQFARFHMTREGLLEGSAPRGIWEITELGRQRLAQAGG